MEKFELNIVKGDAIFELDTNEFYYKASVISGPIISSSINASDYSYHYELNGETCDLLNAGTYKLVIESRETSNTYPTVAEFEIVVHKFNLDPHMVSDELVYNASEQTPEFEFAMNPEGVVPDVQVVEDSAVNIGTYHVEISLPHEYVNNYALNETIFEYKIIQRDVKITWIKEHSLYVSDYTYAQENITRDIAVNLAESDDITGVVRTVSGAQGVYDKHIQFRLIGFDITRDGVSQKSNYNVIIESYVAIRLPLMEISVKDAVKTDGNNYYYEFNYTGEPYNVLVESNVDGTAISYSLDDKIYMTEMSLVNAGEYHVYFKAVKSGYETYQGIITIVINKINITIDAVDQVYEYNGHQHDVEYTISPENVSNLEIYIEYGYDREYIDDPIHLLAPIFVGKYIAYIEVPSTQNYVGVTKEIKLEVVKGDSAMSLDPSYQSQEYSGYAVKDPSVSVALDNPVLRFEYEKYNTETEMFEPISYMPINVGRYRVTATVEGTDTYAEESKSMEFEIYSKKVYVTWDNTEFIYDGTVQTPKADVFDVFGDKLLVNYVNDPSKNVGEYTIVASSANSNYTIVNSTIGYNIVPRTILVTASNSYYTVVDDIKWTDVITNSHISNLAEHDVFNGKLTLNKLAIGEYRDFADFSWDYLTITNNSDDVTSNYILTYNLFVNIRERAQQFTWSNLNVNYNGTAQAPVLETQEGTISTFIYNGVESDTIPEFTNAGEYEIGYKLYLEGYEDVEDTVTFIINKLTPTIDIASISKVYDGENRIHYTQNGSDVHTYSTMIQEATAVEASATTNSTDEYEITFKYYDLSGRLLDVAPSAAGVYYVIAHMDETTNYNAVDAKKTFTIEKRDSEFATYVDSLGVTNYLVSGFNEVYGQGYSYLEYTIIAEGSINVSYYSLDKNTAYSSKPTAAGKYYALITIEETSNYKSESIWQEFEISKRVVRVEGTQRHVYDGNNYTGNLSDFVLYDNVTGSIITNATVYGVISTTDSQQGEYTGESSFSISSFRVEEAGVDVTDNYSVSFNMTVVIEKASANFESQSVTVNYDGFGHGIEFDMSNVDGDYSIQYSLDGINYSEFFKPVNAGVYNVYYKIIFENYKTETGNEVLTIRKIDDTVVPNFTSIQYIEAEIPTPRISRLGDGDLTITFFDASMNELLINPVNVGNYTMRVEISEGTNYKAYSHDYQFEVTPKHVDVYWSFTTAEFNNKVQKPVASIPGINDPSVSITYSKYVDCDYISVGYQYIEASIDSSNYILNNSRLEYTITQFTVNLPEDLTVEYTGKVNELSFVGIEVIGNTYVNVGVYELTARLLDARNYKWADGDRQLTKTFRYEITVRDIASPVVILENIPNQGYTGQEITPALTMTHNGNYLVEGVDYTVKYTNNIDVFGTAVVEITGIGNYTGTTSTTFMIVSNVIQFTETSKYHFVTATSVNTFEDKAHSSYSSKEMVLITNVKSNTTIREFLNNIPESQRNYIKVQIYNSIIAESAYDTTYIATGAKVSYYNKFNTVVDIVYVSIRGDVNGDGEITLGDYSQASVVMRSGSKYAYEYYAADINRDGVVNRTDTTILRNHVNGKVNIDEAYND
jgi:hypothetical protein